MIFDFILIVLFVVTFKLYDIYVATMVIIAGAALQVIVTRLRHKRFDKKQVALLAVIFVFGGMTLYFHDPIFIKWKPTVVFWIMGLALLISQFVGKEPLVQRLMGHVFEGKHVVPNATWRRLNIAWMAFFLLIGTINVFAAYYLSTEAWVNFKIYGIIGAFILFAIVQSIFLARYLTTEKE